MTTEFAPAPCKHEIEQAWYGLHGRNGIEVHQAYLRFSMYQGNISLLSNLLLDGSPKDPFPSAFNTPGG